MTTAEAIATLLYGAGWLSFALGHSLLAGERLKKWFGAGYRLGFNVIAIVHGAVICVGGWMLFDGAATPSMAPMALAVHVAGWTGMGIALRDYDLGRFFGWAQIRAARAGEVWDQPEPLSTRGLHRYVRHPLYVFAFMVLWSAAGNPFGLATALWASLYLVVGSKIEERRLLTRYGEA